MKYLPDILLNIQWLPYKVQELAAKAGAVVPGKQPQGKLPPRKPGDEEKIARRLGQSASSNGNGNNMHFNTTIISLSN